MSKKKVVGDPSPQSVLSVDEDSKYERMRDFVGGDDPSAAEVVYKHKESGTFGEQSMVSMKTSLKLTSPKTGLK